MLNCYNTILMIWSTPPHTVELVESLAKEQGSLRYSGLINELLLQSGIEFEPVKYTLPAASQARVARLVQPVVTLGKDGSLIHPGDGLYVVNMRAFRRKEVSDEGRQTMIEAHALAEKLALTRGIFGEASRKSAELTLAQRIWPHFVSEYSLERLSHLEVLKDEAGRATDLSVKQKELVVGGLDQAIESLARFQ